MAEKSNYALGEDAQKSRLNSLLQWIDDNADAMLSDPKRGLEAIGVGRKNAEDLNESDSDWCVVGFVKRKLSEKHLANNGIEAFASAARSFDGDDRESLAAPEMDVVETGGAFETLPGLSVPAAQRGAFGGSPPSVDLQKPFDALRIGLGITNPVGTYPKSLGVGTLGFFVRDNSGKVYLVSNNHVIGRENAANKAEAVVQPGTLDLTQTELSLMPTLNKLRSKLQIAEVSDVVDIHFGTQANEVDVAVAELLDERDQSLLARIGLGACARGIAPPFTVDAAGVIQGETRVYKAGRTTGWTEGRVSALAVVSQVGYSGKSALFRNQLAITASSDNNGPFSRGGDSGSGIFDVNNNLVGLLFAGSPSRTLANPIGLVMSAITTKLNAGPLTLVT